MEKPKIVCLCGSTKFYKEFQRANYEQTLAGKIVLSVGFYPQSSEEVHGEKLGCTPEQKVRLDQLHLRKIDLADEVLILNKGGYIGESTERELAYTIFRNKDLKFLEPEAGEKFMEENAHRIGRTVVSFLDDTWSDEPFVLPGDPNKIS